MAKKRDKNVAEAAEAVAAATATTADAPTYVTEPADKPEDVHNGEGTETAANSAPQTTQVVTEAPKPAPVYGIVMDAEELAKRHIRKGFETVLITELKNGPGSVDMLVARLLASGEYRRVAPKAAENRPAKPVQELCNRWVGSKILAVASEEEAEVVRASYTNAGAIAAQIEAETPAVSVEAIPEAVAESEPAAASV